MSQDAERPGRAAVVATLREAEEVMDLAERRGARDLALDARPDGSFAVRWAHPAPGALRPTRRRVTLPPPPPA